MPLDFVNYDNPTLELLRKTDEYFNDPDNGWIQSRAETHKSGEGNKWFRCVGGVMAYILTSDGCQWDKIPTTAWDALSECVRQIAPDFARMYNPEDTLGGSQGVAMNYNNSHSREDIHEVVKNAVVFAEAKAVVKETV